MYVHMNTDVNNARCNTHVNNSGCLVGRDSKQSSSFFNILPAVSLSGCPFLQNITASSTARASSFSSSPSASRFSLPNLQVDNGDFYSIFPPFSNLICGPLTLARVRGRLYFLCLTSLTLPLSIFTSSSIVDP
ncbi:hypothetical protein L211DRAFT_699043 [Terfezia boudieri ATCC MYA-4762]|uniref:Uncharacterized protein n=1 Tax=Terfezia boudieri ATCC MYA-4762 TaxID=1051890 RepID=A0A3N4LTA8_9PEZI|nr:hypothetical protein L211DRAFT_699043 [Terfezia boudieri ATCC MYA-4762]